MWLFQVAMLAAALLAGCQWSASPIENDPAVAERLGASREAAPSDETMRASCGPSEICLETPSTAAGACDGALAVLLASTRLSAPARCEVVAETAATEPAAERAAVLRFQHAEFSEPYWVALGDGAGYRRLVELMNVGLGVNGSLALRIEGMSFADVVPGGERELRIEMHGVVDDHDCSGEFSWHTERVDLAVCGRNAQGLYCLGPLPQSLRRYEAQFDPRTERESNQLVDEYTLELTFDADGLLTRTSSGSVPEEARSIIGRHSLLEVASIARELPFPH